MASSEDGDWSRPASTSTSQDASAASDKEGSLKRRRRRRRVKKEPASSSQDETPQEALGGDELDALLARDQPRRAPRQERPWAAMRRMVASSMVSNHSADLRASERLLKQIDASAASDKDIAISTDVRKRELEYAIVASKGKMQRLKKQIVEERAHAKPERIERSDQEVRECYEKFRKEFFDHPSNVGMKEDLRKTYWSMSPRPKARISKWLHQKQRQQFRTFCSLWYKDAEGHGERALCRLLKARRTPEFRLGGPSSSR